MLLSGVATNAVGFDLSPGVSEPVRNYAVGVDKVTVNSAYLLSVNKFRAVSLISN
jgi:hypothetical protein